MSEENLSDLLDRAADGHAVGSPPLDQMLARGRRARKRRARFMVLTASVVVGGLIAGTTWLFNPSDSPGPADSPTDGVVKLDGTWTVSALTNANGISMVSGRNAPITVTFTQGTEGGLQQGPIMPGVGFPNGTVTIDSPQCHFSAKYLQSAGAVRGLRFSSDMGWAVTSDTRCVPEKVLYGALPSVRHATESDGVLSLLAEDGSTIATLEHVFTVPTNLEGKWTFADLTDTGRFDVGPNFRPYSLTFADGRAVEKSGCVTITATYEQRRTSTLVFSDIQRLGDQGRSNCASPPERERLSVVRQVTYTDGTLQLRDENGTIITELRRQSARACTRCPFGFDTGNIKGRVRFAGGLSSTSQRTLFQGLVKFVRPAAAGRSGVKAQVSLGADGTFSVALPPGTYTVTATSPEFTFNGVEGVCRADKQVRVTRYNTSSVTVYCNNK